VNSLFDFENHTLVGILIFENALLVFSGQFLVFSELEMGGIFKKQCKIR
jgi:hypothetical protein